LPEALDVLSYDNARGVLKRAGEMVRTLVAVGAGRAGPSERRKGGKAVEEREYRPKDETAELREEIQGSSGELTALPPYRPTAS
jgi:hypothetical protein